MTIAADHRLFDVATEEWFVTSDREVGRPRLDYFADKIHQASLLVDENLPASVYGFQWGPDFYVPGHYHDVDQIQVVVSGSLMFGNRRVLPGEGVYRPCGRSYNFSTGPTGATILEIRDVASFRAAYNEREAAIVGPGAPTVIEGWERPPGKNDKSVFFDTRSAEVEWPGGWGFGDRARSPESGSLDLVGFQRLVDFPDEDSFNLLGVVFQPRASVQAHRQDAARTVYVLSGRLEVSGRWLPAGAGAYIEPGGEASFETGDVGAQVIEFRNRRSWTTEW